MAYHAWHEQPGYFKDITRHFPRFARVLDIGCGTGWLAAEFENYVGIDTDVEAVKVAVANGIDVRLGSPDGTLSFADCSFDAVVLKDVLEHLQDPVRLVLEVKRVLRSGGLAFASAPDAQRTVWHDYTHVRPFTKQSMRRLWEDQGMRTVRLSYESVAPGSSRVAAMTRHNRRPLPYRVAAHMPFLPRNVWILARNP